MRRLLKKSWWENHFCLNRMIIKRTVHAVMEDVDLEEGECLILMGHGTDHHANSAYPALEYTLQALGYDRIHVATVEGFPELKDVMHRIEQSSIVKWHCCRLCLWQEIMQKMTWQEMRIPGNVSWKKPDMKFARS